MEISMSAIIIATENNAGNLSIGNFIEITVVGRELKIAKTQSLPQAYAARNIENRLLGHISYNRRIQGEHRTVRQGQYE
jgi:hypothetical protein